MGRPVGRPRSGGAGLSARLARSGLVLAALLAATAARAEDGYDLWLRYRPLGGTAGAKGGRPAITEVVIGTGSPTLRAARDEIARGLRGMLGVEVPLVETVTRDGALVAGTPARSSAIAAIDVGAGLGTIGNEGFVIRSMKVAGKRATVIVANTDIGVLYGVFRLLQLLQTGQPIDALSLVEAPRIRHRLLNHWDNLNRTVERGYAGFSLWDWHKLPDYRSPRYTDYARANASIGINGTVLTNVNANATSLTAEYLGKAAALADVFRPYGIRVYLTARFSAPIEIGGLATADPLDPAVAAWWKRKAAEIYGFIPDFGGFLVKANSEGQPGPQDYGRTHADGANVLADAVGPHGGIVMWRAFVYSNEVPDDRAKQAYNEFQPLDGSSRRGTCRAGEELPPRLPAPRALPPPLRGDAEDAADDGVPDHAGVPRLRHAPRVPGAAVRGDPAGGHLGEGRGLHRRPGDRRLAPRPRDHRASRGSPTSGTDRNWCGSAFACANWYA